MNLTVAVNLLKKTRIQIDTATGGAEAINLAEKNAYDLSITLPKNRHPKMLFLSIIKANLDISDDDDDDDILEFAPSGDDDN